MRKETTKKETTKAKTTTVKTTKLKTTTTAQNTAQTVATKQIANFGLQPITLTPEEKKAMDELKGKIYGRTVFDKDFEKALNGKPFVFRYPQKGEPLKQYFDQHGVIIVTN